MLKLNRSPAAVAEHPSELREYPEVEQAFIQWIVEGSLLRVLYHCRWLSHFGPLHKALLIGNADIQTTVHISWVKWHIHPLCESILNPSVVGASERRC